MTNSAVATEPVPRISVIIPCYNQGAFVGEAVDSVLAQEFRDFEIIVVNDGSTDEPTNELLKRFSRPKTKIIHTENQGLAAARNNGIREARGKYILPLDADDRIGPGYLEQAVTLLDSRPELGIVYCRARLFGAVEVDWQLPEFSLDEMLLDNIIFCSAVFRRSDWQEVGGYDESLCYGWEDYDFWLSLLEKGCRVYRIEEILFYYRVSPDSMVRARPRQHKLDTFVRLYRKHRQLYSDNIHVWIDRLIDAREQYHEAELVATSPSLGTTDDPQVRKVDTGTRRLEFQLAAAECCDEMIFIPAREYLALRIHGISYDRKGQCQDVTGWETNADVSENGTYVFCTGEPEVRFFLPSDEHADWGEGRLVIDLEYVAFGRDCLPILLELLRGCKKDLAETFSPEDKLKSLIVPEHPFSGWQVGKALVKRTLKAIRYALPHKRYRIIHNSGLLDIPYYCHNVPGLDPLLIDPFIHYLENGWREGRNPNPLFESSWYREKYQLAADQDPLIHYIEQGWKEGNDPSYLFSTSYYARHWPGSPLRHRTPLYHYLHQGWKEGKNPHPCFDTAYYLSRHPEIEEAGLNPLYHYYHIGNPARYSPMPFFDMEYYCENNPAVAREWMFPILHYFEHGAEEGKTPNRFFDPRYYQKTYQLDELSGFDLFKHYVRHGAPKNFRPSALFDPDYYARTYPHFRKTHAHPLEHYQEIGLGQGLYPCAEVAELAEKPVISILTPVYNTEEDLLCRCINSVISQAYPHWELCLVDDGSSAGHIQPLLEKFARKDPRIKIRFLPENQGIAEATNQAAQLAGGKFLAFLDHDDELTIDALYEVAKAINDYDPDVLYSDEDLIDGEGGHLHAFYKPDFNPELLLCHNYITHFLVTRRDLFDQVGGLSSAYDGAQDFDLVLRLSEAGRKVHHIRRVIYHWRATQTSTSINHEQKDYADEAGLRAVQAAVQRRGLAAEVKPGKMKYYYALHRQVTGRPLVDICILFEPAADQARQWLPRLCSITSHENFTLYLQPTAPLPPREMEQLARVDSRVKVLPQTGHTAPAALLNTVIQAGQGEYVCCLDQGVLPEDDHWLQTLLGYAREEDTGLVGGLVTDRGEEPGSEFTPDLTDESIGAYHFFLTQASVHANGLFCPQQVLAVSSELCMFRRRDFEKAGCLDVAAFPAGLFDVDLCFQLREQGLKHVFTPFCKACRTRDTLEARLRTAAPGEKERFQRKWRQKLLSCNPFVNRQHILEHSEVTEQDCLRWFVGAPDSGTKGQAPGTVEIPG